MPTNLSPTSSDAPPAPLWILWLDGLAGLAVGIFVLALRDFLTPLYGLPASVVAMTGVANLLYSTFGLTLVHVRRRPHWLVHTLVVANYLWAVVCVVLAVTFLRTATIFGLGHIVLEGAFVAGLATIEWRRRDVLVGPRGA